jgi:hypothetical protein
MENWIYWYSTVKLGRKDKEYGKTCGLLLKIKPCSIALLLVPTLVEGTDVLFSKQTVVIQCTL